eukprot:XP_014061388.1 PREDICTED: dynein heavy chain 8, axonemal-like [Salmo salar]
MSGTSHPDSTGDPSPMADNVPTDRGAVGRRGSKFHRSGSCVQTVQETMKEKQARYKESREARKKLLTPGHKYIFEILADRLSLELQAVEEFVLDAPSLAPFDDFFAKGGSKTIAFVYQETEVPGIGKLLVNFDTKITEIVRETKCMLKMGLEVPDQALRLVKTEWSMKANKLRLEVESVLRHGLVLLNWSSLILDNFFHNVDTAMSELNHLLKKVRDICEMHIDAVLQDISETVLIDLPEDRPSSLQGLISTNEVCPSNGRQVA